MMDNEMIRYFFAVLNRELLRGSTPGEALQCAASDYACVLLASGRKIVRVAPERDADAEEGE